MVTCVLDGSLVPASVVAVQVKRNSVPASGAEGMKAAVPLAGLTPTRTPVGSKG